MIVVLTPCVCVCLYTFSVTRLLLVGFAHEISMTAGLVSMVNWDDEQTCKSFSSRKWVTVVVWFVVLDELPCCKHNMFLRYQFKPRP